MEIINKVENMVSRWLKPIPHLPNGGRKWIAENAWWIVLVGVIASVIGLLIGISSVITYASLVGTYSYVYAASPYSGGWIIGSVVGLLFSVVNVILLATAIKPLQHGQKKGWERLFLVLIVSALSVVISAVLSFSVFGFIFGIIFGAIGVAISAYFIFEIRSHFVAAKAHSKK